MRYDPTLVFAAALEWWRSQPESHRDFAAVAQARHAIRLRIYVRDDESGHFLLNGSDRAYWQPAGERGWQNTRRTLADEADRLGPVIMTTAASGDIRHWPSFEAFAREVGLD